VDLHRVESGSKVRVLVVRLDDGTEVTVPRANVEIIEEESPLLKFFLEFAPKMHGVL